MVRSRSSVRAKFQKSTEQSICGRRTLSEGAEEGGKGAMIVDV